jgi:methylmalonyl-CoA/ethylmalonyl-CoA epimerase
VRLHHIGHLVKDIPAAAKALVGDFGYRIESNIIEDPVQTVMVQFLRLPGERNWFELVSPNGPGSKVSAALAKGGGLHHLCYEVDDLDASCAALRRQRMWMLSGPVPAVAFDGRRIAWFVQRTQLLVELLESGEGALTLTSIGL